jgi:hypothetical protein
MEVGEAGLQVGVVHRPQQAPDLGGQLEIDGRQAPRPVVLSLLQVATHHVLDRRVVRLRDRLPFDQDPAERLVLGRHPGIQRRDQGIPADEPHL